MPYITVEGNVHLYYEETGSGTPLIFIHPPGMGHVVFCRQQSLAHHFRVIMYDMRGNGKSSSSNRPITIPLLADDLRVLLDALHIKQAVICGYSNGGSIALEFALRYSDKVKMLALIGGFPEVCTPLLRYEFLLGIYTVKLGAISLLANILAKAHGSNKKEKREIKQYVQLVNKRDLVDMYEKGLIYRCTKRLSSLCMPLLLIYGASDYYMHPYAKIFKKTVPHAKVVYIDKARHQIPIKHHCELNGILKTYCIT
ncbi:alpha/beta hydrolase [Parageobacillus sp. VR-IP]|uniref:alpha/beta fold hydrolase n=1 Tax=Parageobacillus sp. VR-IP TaxID=2742205 RepID=UPI001582100E|nr:alpha/beta hydrolase [Parageobacillus sp. VR-IP]NUK28912.1 alpha/beta hydrolase [Parageobacillus sp. VR-IP]